MKRPSNEARNAMLKVATQVGVTRKKEGQIRKAEDVAEDLEVRMLSQGRTMLRDSAGKPDEKQGETSALSELRSRLECMASDTHVEELLQNLSALEEWQRKPQPSNRIGDAMLKAATKLGVKRKDRKASDVGQDMEAKILSRGIELMEQRKLPNLF